MDVLGLADPVDAAHALLEPVRVPRDVVVDHQVAELEVDALAGRLGGDHDLRLLAEVALLLDPLAQLHSAVDHCDLEVRREVLDEVVEGVLVLGEDEELLAAVLLSPWFGRRRAARSASARCASSSTSCARASSGPSASRSASSSTIVSGSHSSRAFSSSSQSSSSSRSSSSSSSPTTRRLEGLAAAEGTPRDPRAPSRSGQRRRSSVRRIARVLEARRRCIVVSAKPAVAATRRRGSPRASSRRSR